MSVFFRWPRRPLWSVKVGTIIQTQYGFFEVDLDGDGDKMWVKVNVEDKHERWL